MAERRGQIVVSPLSGGRTVGECWYELFIENERAFKEARWSDVRTDAEIAKEIKRMFPRRKQPSLVRVRHARYEADAKLGEDLRPDVPALLFQYKLNDEGRVCRITNKGRVLRIGGQRTKRPGKLKLDSSRASS